MRRPLLSVILLAVAVVTGCNVPSEQEVRRDFQRTQPSAEVLDVYVGEGDSDHAYFTIRHRKRGDGVVYKDCWVYSDANRDQWQVIHKSTVPEASAPKDFCR